MKIKPVKNPQGHLKVSSSGKKQVSFGRRPKTLEKGRQQH